MAAHLTNPLLRIAVSFGALSPQLAPLISMQRWEEPQTAVVLLEVPLAEQIQGLHEGRYEAGVALTPASEHSLHAQALWSDQLAVALPQRSPLLALPGIPLEELSRYPVVRWSHEACSPVAQRVDKLLGSHPARQQDTHVQSFEAMALLVAAGYGIGLGPRSLIETSHGPGVVTRPLAGIQHDFTTYLLHAGSSTPATVDRLAQRARALSHSSFISNLSSE